MNYVHGRKTARLKTYFRKLKTLVAVERIEFELEKIFIKNDTSLTGISQEYLAIGLLLAIFTGLL